MLLWATSAQSAPSMANCWAMLAWSAGKAASQMELEATFPELSLEISVAWWAQIAIFAQSHTFKKSVISQEMLFISESRL